MAIIQIREHERLNIGSRDPERASLSEEQASALRRLERTLPAGAIRWGHKSVKFSQFCGVIYLGQDSIEILPKLHGRETEPGVSRQILIKMLYAARQLVPPTHGAAHIDLQRHHLLDVFIQHFCQRLFEQVHQGLIKIYIEQQENLPVVKGRILLAEQFKNNLAHQERVYCAYDELKEDNIYNQVIKATLRLLYRLAKMSALRQKLTELLFIFDGVSDVPLTSNDVVRLPRNRLVKRYEEIFRMCEWFLSGMSPDVVVGKHAAVALLFDMNKLFEAFVVSKMRKNAIRLGFQLRSQGPQRYLSVDDRSQKNLFLLKPDITLLDKQGHAVLIVDTKWKLLDSTDNKYGVSQADIYQMLAYASQYTCDDVVLAYPAHSELTEEAPTFVVKRGGYRVGVWKIDLAGLAGIGASVDSQIQNKLMELLDI